MSDITCPHCKKEWPAVSEQGVAIELTKNQCLSCYLAEPWRDNSLIDRIIKTSQERRSALIAENLNRFLEAEK